MLLERFLFHINSSISLMYLCILAIGTDQIVNVNVKNLVHRSTIRSGPDLHVLLDLHFLRWDLLHYSDTFFWLQFQLNIFIKKCQMITSHTIWEYNNVIFTPRIITQDFVMRNANYKWVCLFNYFYY